MLAKAKAKAAEAAKAAEEAAKAFDDKTGASEKAAAAVQAAKAKAAELDEKTGASEKAAAAAAVAKAKVAELDGGTGASEKAAAATATAKATTTELDEQTGASDADARAAEDRVSPAEEGVPPEKLMEQARIQWIELATTGAVTEETFVAWFVTYHGGKSEAKPVAVLSESEAKPVAVLSEADLQRAALEEEFQYFNDRVDYEGNSGSEYWSKVVFCSGDKVNTEHGGGGRMFDGEEAIQELMSHLELRSSNIPTFFSTFGTSGGGTFGSLTGEKFRALRSAVDSHRQCGSLHVIGTKSSDTFACVINGKHSLLFAKGYTPVW